MDWKCSLSHRVSSLQAGCPVFKPQFHQSINVMWHPKWDADRKDGIGENYWNPNISWHLVNSNVPVL
jgi:hypothetical protein